MLSFIQQAGWPIWPLLATSLILVALVIERLIALRSVRILPPNLLAEVIQLARQSQLSHQSISKLEENSALGRVLAATAKTRKLPRERSIEAIETIGKAEIHQLNQYISALGTIASLAPLMGLFGTVVGMIDIFSAYSPTDSHPALLAQGISIALYNTGFGILIAMPAMIFYRYFRGKVDDLAQKLELAALQLLEVLDESRA